MKRRIKLPFYDYEIAAAVIIFCLFILTRFYGIAVVSGHSMEPFYRNDDIVIAAKHKDGQPLMRGDVVLVKHGSDGLLMVKRVVAVPGDHLIAQDGSLYVNGEPEDGRYPPLGDEGCLSAPLVLGDDEYFIMGDNRPKSTDSRTFGPVSSEDVFGVVIARF